MARQRRKPVWPVAASIDMCAAMLDCRRKTLVDAIATKKLRAYRDRTSARIRVRIRDLEKYLIKHWSPL